VSIYLHGMAGHRAGQPKTPTAGAGVRIVAPIEFLFPLGTHNAYLQRFILYHNAYLQRFILHSILPENA
jgi:hypothetical protein